MHYARFIAQRLSKRQPGGFSGLVMVISFTGIGLSVAVMLIAYATVNGFKGEIKEKITGFDGDLLIHPYHAGQNIEGAYFDLKTVDIESLKQVEGVQQVYPICSRAGIVSTAEAIEGLIFKGVEVHYADAWIGKRIVRGKFPGFDSLSPSYGILISEKTSVRIERDTGDKLDVLFIDQGNVRRRRFVIEGIYSTGLAEHDQTFGFCDLRVIQRLVSMGYDTLSGLEMALVPGSDINRVQQESYRTIAPDLRIETSSERNFSLFEWLGYLDTNVVVILSLMFFVAGVNMSSGIFVLIIERTRMIGVLKAMGADAVSVLRIFISIGLRLLFGGVLLGNILAAVLIGLQKTTGFLKLDEEIYYLDRVPFHLEWHSWILINGMVLMVCALILLLPVFLIQKISPVKTLRFD